jgi:predicted AAA+ superfamily ATPase
MWDRKAETKLRRLLRQFPCVCILGSRQVGKTTLAKRSFKGCCYYDLESPAVQDRVRLAPEEFLSSATGLLVLDEIQSIPEIMNALKVAIDARRRYNGRFLILGSANPGVLKTASETLAGRVGFVDLDPLMASECAQGTPALNVNDVLLRGGYPVAAKTANGDNRFVWLESFVRTFIERDLAQFRIDIQPALMRKLLLMIAHVHGSIWNASQLASSAGVSYHTINRYVEIMETAFIVRSLQPYHVNIGKRITKSPKIFLRDSGLRHYLLGIRTLEALRNSPYCGASWEGFIIEEIIRNEQCTIVPARFYFYRTQAGLEADLIMERADGGKTAIEIKYGTRIEKIWIKKLQQVMADVNAKNGLLIYSGKETFAVSKNVKVVSAYENNFAEKCFS